MKRTLAFLAIPITAVAFLAIPAAVGSAHKPNVESTCSKLKLDFTDYEGDATNNTVTVTIKTAGHTQVVAYSFASHLSKDVPWSTTASHTWTVNLNANIHTGDPTKWDFSQKNIQAACNPPATSTTLPPNGPPVTEAPATTVPGSVPTSTAPATTALATTTTVDLCADSCVLAGGTTTTVLVAQDVGPTTPRPTTPRAPAQTQLPATGDDTGLQAAVAVAVLMLGLGLIRITRRPA